MAERESIGGAFDALQERVFEVENLVRGFVEVAHQVGGDEVALPAWLSAAVAHVEALQVAADRLQPHVFRRTPEGRAARKALANLPRRVV